ncbi:MAG: hypothetical protein P8J24_06170, partial [Arenicellales bacterium]|nr:hypothetical protein [Arenicellales bacterium]
MDAPANAVSLAIELLNSDFFGQPLSRPLNRPSRRTMGTATLDAQRVYLSKVDFRHGCRLTVHGAVCVYRAYRI